MPSLTRVAPSRLVPGAKGVFITRALKKFTPVEVAPPPDAIAPPYLVNLLRTPPHAISLRRFLALRHQFSSGTYFNVATPGGWYLIVPGNHAPLADLAGLQAWRERHHHRYEQKATGRSRKKCEAVKLGQGAKAHKGTPPPLGTHNDGGEGVSPAAAQEEFHQGDDVGNDMEEEEESAAEAEGVGAHAAAASPSGAGSTLSRASRLGAPPVVIPEGHLFEINDGVLWETPPQDDLGSPAYWRQHRLRMQLYDDTSVSAEQGELLGPTPGEAGHKEAPGYVERERYAQAQRLLQTLTRKANVKLIVDDDRRLLTLVPIIDLKEGDELLLHYGREWWSQRLLSTLFMSVADSEMRDVRWIEALFTKPTDVSRPFPLLCSAVARRRLPKRMQTGQTVQAAGVTNAETAVAATATRQDALVLYNVVTRRKATDAEALFFAVRRSCVDRSFFSSLLGPAGAGVFDVARCDDEVPLRQLRRALLQSLRQEGVSAGTPAAPGCDAQEEEEEGDDGALSF
ncbi:uncharacterized protein Tco025E_05885 [Trypanosoma conorhini]|uniref:SET domain-containing protein n=1 Tax=Trypanosoma conorhini TaxID=83891 RepID=A0A3R7MGM7_9TRYP|nr:uncharacterized protein Tco025E_05885 [Trypanosoma conorhini]RNF14790.1 hypothetical protein Tco025E_05885 [Trypanosoma conorhini]